MEALPLPNCGVLGFYRFVVLQLVLNAQPHTVTKFRLSTLQFQQPVYRIHGRIEDLATYSCLRHSLICTSCSTQNFAILAGALIGLATAGPLSDWVSARVTKRNRGITEPGMRLPTKRKPSSTLARGSRSTADELPQFLTSSS